MNITCWLFSTKYVFDFEKDLYTYSRDFKTGLSVLPIRASYWYVNQNNQYFRIKTYKLI